MQRAFLLAAVLALLVGTGCVHEPAKSPPLAPPARSGSAGTNAPPIEPQLIVTPESALNGKVVLANANLRFVVLSFPIGEMPAADQRMNVYRRGLKVGEVKVNAQPLEDNVTADIIAGEAAVGDSVRDR